MDNYDEYARTAGVYCQVYAKRKTQPCSPVAAPSAPASENHDAASPSPVAPFKSPSGKAEEPKEDSAKAIGKSDGVLGSLTLNPSAGELKSVPKPAKPQQHTPGDKKKWMKRI